MLDFWWVRRKVNDFLLGARSAVFGGVFITVLFLVFRCILQKLAEQLVAEVLDSLADLLDMVV